MPIARFQLPDGRVARFEVPEGTTPEQAQGMMEAHFSTAPSTTPAASNASAPPVDTKQQAIDSIKERLDGTGPFTAITEPIMKMGSQIIAKPVADIAGLGAMAKDLITGDKSGDPAGFKEYVQNALTYQPRTEAGKIGDAINPLNLIGKAVGSVAQGAGDVVRGDNPGQVRSALANATQEAIPQAVGFAGVKGNPINTAVSKGAQAAADIVGSSINAFRPTAIAAKKITDLAGDAKSKIAQAMIQAKQYVPGSKVTAQEAIAQANLDSPTVFGGGVVKLQQDLSKVPGYTQDKLAGIEKVQESARKAAIDSVAQTPEALSSAQEVRGQNAATNYGQAYSQIVKADPELAKLASNPYFKDALPQAEKLAKSKNISFKNNPTEYLQLVKISLDDALSRGRVNNALGGTEQAAIEGVRKGLIDWLDKKNPDYGKARAAFAKDSVPVNTMQIGQTLQDALTSPKGEERAGVFLNKAQDAARTIKTSTGRTMFDSYDQVMSPQAAKVVDALSKDLTRESAVQKMAKNTTNPGDVHPQIPQLPMMLNPVVSIANKGLKTVFGDLNTKANKIATDILSDPKKMREIMTRPKSDATRKVVESILNKGQMMSPYQGESN